MAKSKQSSGYAYAFTAIAVLALAAILYIALGASSADDSEQQATVNNAAPTVTNVNIATTSGGGHNNTLTLVEGGSKAIYVHGEAADANGCTEINAAADYSINFFETSLTSSGCDAGGEADDYNCYLADEADIAITNCSGGADTTADYEWTASGADGIQYFAQAAEFTAGVVVNDGTTTGSASSTTTIQSMVGVDVTATINYGSLNLGATSTEQTITVTNKGNVHQDININGNDLTCTSGTIDAQSIVYNLTSAQGHGSGTQVPDSATAVSGFDLADRESTGSDTTKNIYTYLQLPVSGISGSCAGDMVISGKSDA